VEEKPVEKKPTRRSRLPRAAEGRAEAGEEGEQPKIDPMQKPEEGREEPPPNRSPGSETS